MPRIRSENEQNPQYDILSPWAYIRYILLFCIPIVGIICLFVFSFSDANYNRRNFARSYFCWLLLVVIILAIVVGAICIIGAVRTGASPSRLFARISRSITRTIEEIFEDRANNSDTAANNEETDITLYTSDGVSEEFSEAMESYEAFIDEYIAFFTNYNESDASLSDLNAAVSLSTQAVEFSEKMDALEKSNMTDEEALLFTEVQMRVTQKLLAAGLTMD